MPGAPFSDEIRLHEGSAAAHLSPSYPLPAVRGTADLLRAWQREALEQYLAEMPRDFLAAATPGAGKTTFALRLASELRLRRVIERITVVAPTEHLKRQWADAAHHAGLRLDPTFRNADIAAARGFHGIVITYAQLAMRPGLHKAMAESKKSLIILDEVHHGGDSLSWGDAIRVAFDNAEKRLLLTGTPFRSDTSPIPFVRYEPTKQGIRVSQSDYSYGYARALKDGVVRPVLFMVYSGNMRWRTRAGDEISASLGEDNTKDVTAGAWRTALEPTGEWIPAVLTAADRRLEEIRRTTPDAGGLVIASDQSTARAYAAILEQSCGEKVTVVLSDDKGSSNRIDSFARSNSKWMVAVRMVSEGVDVPRLAVGVYATSASTPLFFAQAVGRFVRARRQADTATVFLPHVPSLIALAGELERERDHALDRSGGPSDDGLLLADELLTAAEASEKASAELELGEWTAVESSAVFDHVLFEGTGFGARAVPGSDEELDFIGLPGILEPHEVAELLRQRQARQERRVSNRVRAAASDPAGDPGAPGSGDAPGSRDGSGESAAVPELPPAIHRTRTEQRRLLNSLVGMWARESGQSHAAIHAELRRAGGGPEVARATVTELQTRVSLLKKRLRIR